MSQLDVKIEESWKEVLNPHFQEHYFKEIVRVIKSDIANGMRVYPRGGDIFNAFNRTPFERVKVVILGQDPYHGEGQAHGLSFSVPDGVRKPPSLVNIFKELESDLGVTPPLSGNLERWADEGVLLLNAILTVRAGEPTSHSKIGWENFTDQVISELSARKEGVIFLLWGRFARGKVRLIDSSKHHILEAAHPSPLARGAFFGSRHFSTTNRLLKEMGKDPIKW